MKTFAINRESERKGSASLPWAIDDPEPRNNPFVFQSQSLVHKDMDDRVWMNLIFGVQSPDLNTKEHLWNELEQSLSQARVT